MCHTEECCLRWRNTLCLAVLCLFQCPKLCDKRIANFPLNLVSAWMVLIFLLSNCITHYIWSVKSNISVGNPSSSISCGAFKVAAAAGSVNESSAQYLPGCRRRRFTQYAAREFHFSSAMCQSWWMGGLTVLSEGAGYISEHENQETRLLLLQLLRKS